METVINDTRHNVIATLCDHFNLDKEKALETCKTFSIENKNTNPLKPTVTLPFCGVVQEDWCQAIRINNNLFTQCNKPKHNNSDFCKTCNKHKSPPHGNINNRDEAIQNKNVTNYANVMKKLGITREQAIEEANKLGWTIPEEQFQEKIVKKGRKPSKVETQDTDEDKPKKKRGRPKKVRNVTSTSSDVGDDLIAKLLKQVRDDEAKKQQVPETIKEEA